MQIKVIAPKERIKTKIRVCAYCRVSTEADEQENSLTNQRDYYENLIRSNPAYEYVDVYYDFGISGFKESRPGFQRMMEDARAGKIDLILTKSISRMARNTVTMLKAVRELQSMGVGIFFELQNINTLSGEGELMLSIYSAFAQAESDESSKNAYMTYERKFKEGISAVQFERCFGFRLDSEGNPAINEREAFIVRKIFKLTHEGVAPTRIATHLNEMGIRTRTGKRWDATGIFRTLRNEKYKGDVMMQKTYLDANRVRHKNTGEKDRYYIADNHPAIVDADVWNEVQEILDDRSIALQQKKEPKKMGGNSHNTYPLSGMLYCPKCGGMLHHRVSNGGRQTYWCCGTRIKKGRDKCAGITVPEEIANGWSITEPTTVLVKEDEFARKSYSLVKKAEYEKQKNCPYKVKERKSRYSHSTYPLSGKMYCSKCGSVMHHQWGWNGKEFWWCSKRVKAGASACEGVRIPAEIADAWEFEGSIYVMEGEDENGKISYSYQSKS